MEKQEIRYATGAEALARLYWMFLGNIVLLFLLIFIVEKHAKMFGFLDIAYWTVVASLVLVRYADVRYLHGETGFGQPATMLHWRHYTELLALVSAVAWLLGHVIVSLS